jgi:hypothetical protein
MHVHASSTIPSSLSKGYNTCYTRAVVTAHPQHCTQLSTRPGTSAYMQPGHLPPGHSTSYSTWKYKLQQVGCTALRKTSRTQHTLMEHTRWTLDAVCWHKLIMYTSVHTIRNNVQAKEGTGQCTLHHPHDLPCNRRTHAVTCNTHREHAALQSSCSANSNVHRALTRKAAQTAPPSGMCMKVHKAQRCATQHSCCC